MADTSYVFDEEAYTKMMEKYVDLWRDRGYSEQSEFALLCIACSPEGIHKYGNEQSAISRLIQIIKENQNEQAILDLFVKEVLF